MAASPVVFRYRSTAWKNQRRGVGRVIEALVAAVGKHVGDEPVAHVLAERAKDIAGFEHGGR